MRSLEIDRLTCEMESLLDTCRLIHEFFGGIAMFDMHCGNAMINPKTGRVVITDPVSFRVKKETPEVDRLPRFFADGITQIRWTMPMVLKFDEP